MTLEDDHQAQIEAMAAARKNEIIEGDGPNFIKAYELNELGISREEIIDVLGEEAYNVGVGLATLVEEISDLALPLVGTMANLKFQESGIADNDLQAFLFDQVLFPGLMNAHFRATTESEDQQ